MDLTVKIPTSTGQLVFKNPLMPACAGMGDLIEYKRFYNLDLLGALMPNAIMLNTGSPTKTRKIYADSCGYITSLGNNSMGIDDFAKNIMPMLPWQTTPVIINLKAESKEGMVELAAKAAEIQGLAGLEVNLNCPYNAPSFALNQLWRSDAEVEDMTRKVKAVAKNKAVIIKVPTAECYIEGTICAAQAGGADAFTSFGALNGCAIDIETRTFQCGVVGSGGYCGPGLKPMGLRYCCRARSASSLPIISAGGISCAKEVLEHIMAGAWLVQVGSANLTCPDFMPKLLVELVQLMEEMGINSFDEIRGCVKVK